MINKQWRLLWASLCLWGVLIGNNSAQALPPAEDIPEEVLRTEIILDGRSRLDGEPLTAAEYAELEAYLREGVSVVQLDPKIRELIFLLRLRKAINTLIPFVNF
ncbi:hypothetical protein K4A83_03690 [Spirulina subsalsa FACHB-351]|uniref:Glutathione S-transferase n=1 Tax=Spirulina subsalsa FACHB-351 TaxID=234711 RepID=A0ABT3L1M2_9CYAN|nr:hypothetical protein [Spirulina subsalsa]MCW6035378.1 hypothetical protein [Spirulina subsalsa FACHB-351]